MLSLVRTTETMVEVALNLDNPLIIIILLISFQENIGFGFKPPVNLTKTRLKSSNF
jgi:hypothetical protein